jgi:hypothetical protein
MKKNLFIIFFAISVNIQSQSYCNPTNLPTEIFPPNSVNSSSSQEFVQYLCGPNTTLYDTIPWGGRQIYVENNCKLIFMSHSVAIDNVWLKNTSELTLIDRYLTNIIVHIELGAIINQSPGPHSYHLTIDTCTNIVFPSIDCTTGIKENGLETNFTLSPNPNNGEFEISSDYQLNKIQISNISGQLLYNENTSSKNHKVNLKSLDPGIYFVRIFSKNEISSVKKVLVQ